MNRPYKSEMLKLQIYESCFEGSFYSVLLTLLTLFTLMKRDSTVEE